MVRFAPAASTKVRLAILTGLAVCLLAVALLGGSSSASAAGPKGNAHVNRGGCTSIGLNVLNCTVNQSLNGNTIIVPVVIKDVTVGSVKVEDSLNNWFNGIFVGIGEVNVATVDALNNASIHCVSVAVAGVAIACKK